MCTPSAPSVVDAGDFFFAPSPVSLAGSAADVNPRVADVVKHVECCVVLFTTPTWFLEPPHDAVAGAVAVADAIIGSAVAHARSVAVNARRRIILRRVAHCGGKWVQQM
jgi:hypothetical protein